MPKTNMRDMKVSSSDNLKPQFSRSLYNSKVGYLCERKLAGKKWHLSIQDFDIRRLLFVIHVHTQLTSNKLRFSVILPVLNCFRTTRTFVNATCIQRSVPGIHGTSYGISRLKQKITAITYYSKLI